MSSSTEPSGAGSTEGDRPTLASDVALSNDTKTLDPDHELNVWARDNKLGLVPKVLEVNRDDQYAIVGLGAIVAVTALPLGWFVVDDGRRALVFDEESAVQVELSLANAGDLSPDQILESIHTQMKEQFPDVQHIVLELAGMPTIGFRGITAPNGQPIDQAFMFKPCPLKEGMLLQTRVTAVPERMVQAMNLAEVLTREMKWANE